MDDPDAALPHVVIVGCGFGGLEATKVLDGQPVRITLIDRSNHHLFQPLLYQVATAGLSAPSIASPIRHMRRHQRNLTVLMADVTAIDKARRDVVLSDGQRLRYDHLVVAAGATHSYFGNDHWQAHAPGLKTLADAFQLRARLLSAFERAETLPDAASREPWLNFVVIGGGPTGVEMAGTLAEIARHTLRDEFRRIDPSRAHVLLVEGSDRVLAAFKPAQSALAKAQLERLGVQVRTGCRVVGIDEDGVDLQTADGGTERIASRTKVWAAGVAASPLARTLDVPLDRAGRVIVDEHMNIPGHPEVYVVGDMAAATSLEKDGSRKPVPGVSPGAKQAGRHAARQILARLRGRSERPFHYMDYGNLATIGRKAAVADLGRIQFSGFAAWLFWLFVHVYFLIGFRNRLRVFADWAWAYFTFQRHARIVVEPPSGGRDEA
ncbi:NAD(P)/FAD-dependent oxidoreductase [Mitsuaria sp. GD03876]|uniref:NAD(P)/FAD-dependent oxidoreductase n=1 Tax=Mitsuaria sp. GD03876 TaxID=2975399 RepID=UPI00244A6DE2|nr:NAD(P)/FAD-dependent oxidoreductase [Mitsuaria sp. GD03876]MDH0863775.1 NAD(P)/FAD-dependent oxidoreductase [Mitsuaria sp. GD03876]